MKLDVEAKHRSGYTCLKCILYEQAQFIGRDVRLLQIKNYFCKSEKTTDITLRSHKLLFLLQFFAKSSIYRKVTLIEVEEMCLNL
jgi:hypothetical protein